MDSGKTYNINNNSTLSIQAPDYLIERNKIVSGLSTTQYGVIVTKPYKIVIQNDSTSPLQLISKFYGAKTDKLPAVNYKIWRNADYIDDYYYNNQRYSDVPISYSSYQNKSKDTFYDSENLYLQPSPFQSRQLPNQFLYFRYKSIDGVSNLYAKPTDIGSSITNAYNVLDLNGVSSSTTKTDIWNGTFTNGGGSTYTPNGGGVS